MNALELTSLVTAIANAIAECLLPNETALAASLFVQLGDTLSSILAARALCEEAAEKQTGQ